MTERTYWERLKKIGWLNFVPEAERSDLRARIKKALATDTEHAHLCLRKTTFDAECIDEPGAYCKVLKSLADDSEGVFHPTQLKQEDVVLGKRRYAL